MYVYVPSGKKIMTSVRNCFEDVMLASVLISHVDLSIAQYLSVYYINLPGIILQQLLKNENKYAQNNPFIYLLLHTFVVDVQY